MFAAGQDGWMRTKHYCTKTNSVSLCRKEEYFESPERETKNCWVLSRMGGREQCREKKY
jgi:hypothetical protein